MTKNNICFITNLSFELEPTIKNRLEPYIEESLGLGCEVALCSSDKESLQHNYNKSIQHIQFPAKPSRPTSFIKRAMFEWFEARRLLKSLNATEFNVYIISIPSMFLLFNLSILKNKTLTLDVRDLTWEYLPKSGLINILAGKVFSVLANRSFKYVDSVIVTNDTEVEYFKSRNYDASKFSNGVTLKQFEDLSKLPTPEQSKLTISYVGKVGIAQNLRVFLDVAARFPDLQFNIAGYGPQCSELNAYAMKNKLENVKFLGNLNWDGVLKCYEDSHILYAQLSDNFSGAMPSKLYQYICTSRFIVYGGGGVAAETMSNFDHNIVIEPDNAKALEGALLSIVDTDIMDLNYSNNLQVIEKSYIRETNARHILQGLI
ncbi:MAG: glycosyltransferase [Cycloclasticus sp.]|jgi:Glycosyltransferase